MTKDSSPTIDWDALAKLLVLAAVKAPTSTSAQVFMNAAQEAVAIAKGKK